MTQPSAPCPQGHSNPAGQQYCGQCGTSLAGLCPNGHANPLGQGFCGACGKPLLAKEDAEQPAATQSASEATATTAAEGTAPAPRQQPEPTPVQVGASFTTRTGQRAIIRDIVGDDVWIDVTEDGNHLGTFRFAAADAETELSRQSVGSPPPARPAGRTVLTEQGATPVGQGRSGSAAKSPDASADWFGSGVQGSRLPLIVGIGACLGILIGCTGAWVVAAFISVGGLDASAWGKVWAAVSALSAVALAVVLARQRIRITPRAAVVLTWIVFVVGVCIAAFSLPYVVRVLTLPKADFFEVQLGAQVGWGLWLLVVSSVILAIAASLAAQQIGRDSGLTVSSDGRPAPANTYRWTALATAAAVTAGWTGYYAANWDGAPPGAENSINRSVDAEPPFGNLGGSESSSPFPNPTAPPSTRTPLPTSNKLPEPQYPTPPNGLATDSTGTFTFVVPPGWELQKGSVPLADLQFEGLTTSGGGQILGPNPLASGSALLVQTRDNGAQGYQRFLVLGMLDQSFYAGAEANNARAAVRLASDAGEFIFPFPGTRINKREGSLPGRSPDKPGDFASYDVNFSDLDRPNAQVWAAVISINPAGSRAFVLAMGTDRSPVDTVITNEVAKSITPP